MGCRTRSAGGSRREPQAAIRRGARIDHNSVVVRRLWRPGPPYTNMPRSAASHPGVSVPPSLRTRRAPLRTAGALLALLPVLVLFARAAAAADGYSPDDTYLPQKREIGSPITDRLALTVSYIRAKVHTTLRIDPTGVPLGGTTLSGERDLALPSSNPDGRVELMVRMGERSRLRVDYLQLDRSGEAMLSHPIIFGNQTFPANEQLSSALDWKTMGFTYTYAFLQTDRFEAGAGLGVHLIEADAIGTVPTPYQSHESSAAGAFPTIALDAMWRISSRFAFTARGQYFGATVSGFTGSLGDYHGDFQYRWRSVLAVGAGYSYTRASFESLTHGSPGRYLMSVAGPELFARVSF